MAFNTWVNHGTVVGVGGALTNPWNPTVIFEGNAQILSGTVFKMWFANGPFSGKIYYAESTDGLSWTQYTSNPVVSAAVSYAKVFKNGSTYYLYVTPIANKKSINVYTSSDGLAWTLQASNIIALSGSDWDSNFLAQLSVLIVDANGKWWGYYTGESTITGLWSMGLATSTDGIHWTPSASNPIMPAATFFSPSNFSFEKIGNVFYGWSQVVTPQWPGSNNGVPSDIMRFSATHPGGPWTPLNSMILYRTLASEGIGLTAGQVADPSLVADGSGNLWMFYTANSGTVFVINAAEAPSTTFAQLVGTLEGVQNVPIPGDAPLTDTANLMILASDTFQGADANPIGGNWTPMLLASFAAAQRLSHTMEGTVIGSNSSSYWNAVVWPNDQWAMVTASACVGTSFIGVTLRQTSVAATNTAYRCNWTGTLGGSGTWAIRRTVSGSGSILVSGTITLKIGDVILGAVIGSKLYFYLNGNLLGSATDATPIVSGNAGSTVVPITSLANAAISAWSGGTFQAPPTPSPIITASTGVIPAGYGTGISASTELSSNPAGEISSGKTSIFGTNRGSRFIG